MQCFNLSRKGLVIPGSSQPGEDLLHLSAHTAINNNENIRHFNPQQQQHLHPNQQLSPESSPNNSNPQMWSMYNNNNNVVTPANALYNRCIIGLNQLRLTEFSGFLEKRRDHEIVNTQNQNTFIYFNIWEYGWIKKSLYLFSKYQKHLFVHLNMADYLSNTNPALQNDPASNPADDPNLAEEFEVC